jgi:hypothetical protein
MILERNKRKMHADLVAEDVVIVEIKDGITRIVHRLQK